MKAYSLDLRRRIIDRLQVNEETQPEIAEHFSVSLAFIEKLWHRFRSTDQCEARPHGGGRVRLLKNDEQLIRAAIAKQPDLTLAELVSQVADQTNNAQVSRQTMSVELQRLSLPRKKR